MTETDKGSTAPAPPVAVNRGTVGIENDPTAPAGAERGTVVMRHNITKGITTVPRSAFEGGYRFNGWEEVDVVKERDALYAEAREMGVNVSEDANGRDIVDSMNAYINNNREV